MTPVKKCNYCEQLLDQNKKKKERETEHDEEICVTCGSTREERILKEIIDGVKAFSALRPKLRVLHLSPTPKEIAVIASLKPAIHILGVQNPPDLRFEKIELPVLDYDGESFDLIVHTNSARNNHDSRQIISQYHRLLASKGILIINVVGEPCVRVDDWERGTSSRVPAWSALHEPLYQLNDFAFVFEKFEPIDSAAKLVSSLASERTVSKFITKHKLTIGLQKREIRTLESTKPIKYKISKPETVVSVICATYNHEKFIDSALSSFVEQKTNFPYEIIVADDASTDSTLQIVESYARKHSNIKIIANEKNQGSNKNGIRAVEAAKGRYLAICDGDDYWTDRFKLQKQINHLTRNRGIVLVYGNVQAHREDGTIDYNYVGGIKQNLTQVQLLSAPSINTLTTCFLNIFSKMPNEFVTVGAGDMFLWSLLGNYGGGTYLNTLLPSIYRQHRGGKHSSVTRAEQYALRLQTYYSLFLYYQRIGYHAVAQHFEKRCDDDGKCIVQLLGVDEGIKRLNTLILALQQKASGNFELNLKQLHKIVENAARNI